jgi:hypothetical protein
MQSFAATILFLTSSLLAGPKDSPERLLPISKRPAPVIGLQIEMTSISIPI